MSRAQRRLGRSAYTGLLPAAYDLLVLELSNRYVWHCPKRRLLHHYASHLRGTHLEVAAGTGYLVGLAAPPSGFRRLAILDINRSSAAHAAARLARFGPEVHVRSVLDPIADIAAGFESIGMNYLLHCLPGPMSAKAVAFDHVLPLLTPDGAVFGATLVGHGLTPPFQARALFGLYNRLGIFENAADSAEALRAELEQRFERVAVETVGCAALFSAAGPRGRPRPSAG